MRLREELEWQQEVAEALTCYGQVLESASASVSQDDLGRFRWKVFARGLLEAHQVLLDLGLVLPDVKGQLQELKLALQRGLEKTQTPLGMHSAQLQSCVGKVKELNLTESGGGR